MYKYNVANVKSTVLQIYPLFLRISEDYRLTGKIKDICSGVF